jgi:AcrR family transcriptional regulator
MVTCASLDYRWSAREYHVNYHWSISLTREVVKTAAFKRLEVDERRRQLLKLGAELFARHPYDELSMRKIAQAAGISHPLLYRYFPSKQSFFRAALEQAAAELFSRTRPDPTLPPWEQLTAGLEAFLELIDENALAYRQLMRSVASAPEVRDMVDNVRDTTSEQILTGLFGDQVPPKARAAVRGWLWYMDGVLLDWIEHRDLGRTEVRDLLLGTLGAALSAAVNTDGATNSAAPQVTSA